MEKVVRKLFFVWEYEKEENWLNEMSAKGWQLTHARLFYYRFEQGKPGEYVYQLELLDNAMKTDEVNSYIGFLNETGIEKVGECRQWIYLRCKADQNAFDPGRRSLYDLSHRLKIQEFQAMMLNILMIMVAAGITGTLVLELLDKTPTVEFFRGFCTGIALAGSFWSLGFYPWYKKNSKRIKQAVRELYTCE